jgi:hypothetical protein
MALPPFRRACDTLRLERDETLMSRQAESDQPNSEYSNFEKALKSVLSVPRSELQKRLKDSKKRKPAKKASVSRVASDSR